MAVPYDPTDPSSRTEDQRLDELSALLAIALARLLAQRTSPPISPPPDSSANCLDDSGESRLHVSRPVNAGGERSYT